MPADKTRAKVEARRRAIYDLYLRGYTQRRIYESPRLQQDYGPFAPRTVSDALRHMDRVNAAWYENFKDPAKRVSFLFKQQVDRYGQLLAEYWTLFYTFDNERQASMKLGAANGIERCIYRLCEVLGIKGRSIDDLYLEKTIADMMKKVEEFRQSRKVGPLS